MQKEKMSRSEKTNQSAIFLQRQRRGTRREEGKVKSRKAESQEAAE